jgi:hypothetical protein
MTTSTPTLIVIPAIVSKSAGVRPSVAPSPISRYRLADGAGRDEDAPLGHRALRPAVTGATASPSDAYGMPAHPASPTARQR